MRRGFTLVEALVAAAIIVLLIALVLSCTGCQPPRPVSDSGVSKAHIKVTPGSDGLTVEQRNVSKRVAVDNAPGSIKHVYVISAYSGQVLLYSTAQGKVSSSGKRLTPVTISGSASANGNGFGVTLGNEMFYTQEVLQDDGTYGSSMEYLFWFDVKGAYHQHYVQGGQILHVCDQPMNFGSVQMEVRKLEDK